MSTPAKDSSEKPPVLLPQVRVEVEGSGGLTVTIDRESCDVTSQWRHLGRDALPRIVEEVSRRLASPFRLEVVDDGFTFTDIVIPSDLAPLSTVARDQVSAGWEVAGSGFSPTEDVAVAVVVAHRCADAHGVARLRLPPALLADRPGLVVLFGQASGTVAVSGGTT